MLPTLSGRGRASTRLERLRELILQHRDPPPQRLAFDLRISDLGLAGEVAEQVALAAVKIGSDLMAAIEDKRVAAARIADRHDENRPLEVVGKLGGGGVSGVDQLEGCRAVCSNRPESRG